VGLSVERPRQGCCRWRWRRGLPATAATAATEGGGGEGCSEGSATALAAAAATGSATASAAAAAVVPAHEWFSVSLRNFLLDIFTDLSAQAVLRWRFNPRHRAAAVGHVGRRPLCARCYIKTTRWRRQWQWWAAAVRHTELSIVARSHEGKSALRQTGLSGDNHPNDYRRSEIKVLVVLTEHMHHTENRECDQSIVRNSA